MLDRRETNLPEPVDRGLGKGLVREVGERRPTPEPKCSTKELGGDRRVTSSERLNPVFGAPLERSRSSSSGESRITYPGERVSIPAALRGVARL